jgi:hypothetical protein
MDNEPALFGHDVFPLLVEQSGEFSQLCGTARRTWIGWCNSGDMFVAFSHVKQPLLCPTFGKQLVLREVTYALDDF